MENEENPIYGTVTKDEGEYNLLANYAGAKEFDKRRLLNILLEEVSNEEFNELFTSGARVKIEFETKEVILQGQVLGGSDPTKLLREDESEVKPQQEIKVLLDDVLDDGIVEEIENKRAKIITIV